MQKKFGCHPSSLAFPHSSRSWLLAIHLSNPPVQVHFIYWWALMQLKNTLGFWAVYCCSWKDLKLQMEYLCAVVWFYIITPIYAVHWVWCSVICSFHCRMALCSIWSSLMPLYQGSWMSILREGEWKVIACGFSTMESALPKDICSQGDILLLPFNLFFFFHEIFSD